MPQHKVEEVRSLYTLRCGSCGKQFEEQGARHDDCTAFDLENEDYDVECPHCHVELTVDFDRENSSANYW